MNIEQMKTVLKEIITRTDLTPCVVGHRGVGKTAGIIQTCREIDRRYVSLRLGQMEVGDLIGIPYREGETMRWSRPSWWPCDSEAETVVHCDELNRAQQEDTLQAIFQFVEPPCEGQVRSLHTHRLHPKHRVVVTINPPDGTYQVAPLDRALIDRMVMLHVESDYSCWAGYAAARNLDDGVRAFLAANQGMLAAGNGAMELQAEPSERGWEMVSLLRKNCRFPQEVEMEVYAGIVGKEAAIGLLRWLHDRKNRPVAPEEILNAWEEVAEKASAQRDDRQAATMSSLISLLRGDPSLDESQEENLVSYIGVLPRDMRFALVKSLVTIPQVAEALTKEKHDAVIMESIRAIRSGI